MYFIQIKFYKALTIFLFMLSKKDVKLYKAVLLHLSYGFIFTAQYCFEKHQQETPNNGNKELTKGKKQ